MTTSRTMGMLAASLAAVLLFAACRDAALSDRIQAPVFDINPGTVSDLGLIEVFPTSVTLHFTEVHNGSGPPYDQPANYDMRQAIGTIDWGSAQSVSQGACSTVIWGNSVGNSRYCTVTGLQPNTTYQFQMVPFRGTLNEDAVFGPLSNVVTATTSSASSVFSHQPAGWTTRVDYSFNEDIPVNNDDSEHHFGTNGWWTVWNKGLSSTGQVTHGMLGGNNVADFFYPSGFDDGSGPGSLRHWLNPDSSNVDRMFVGFLVYVDSSWDSQYQSNKLGYVKAAEPNCGNWEQNRVSFHMTPVNLDPLHTSTEKHFQLVMMTDLWDTGHCQPGSSEDDNQYYRPDQGSDLFQLNAWNTVEILIDFSGSDMHVQWWLGGNLQRDAHIRKPGYPMRMLDLTPVWGGNDGDNKIHDDHLYFGQMRIATP